MKTPYITYKIGYSLYTKHEIDFSSLEIPGPKHPPETYSWDQPVLDPEGNVTPECRGALLEHGKSVSARTGLRLCIVCAEDDCEYVAPDGSVLSSDQPPCLIKMAGGNEERIEMIGLPEIVKNPDASPEEQEAWVRKMRWLQAATMSSSAPSEPGKKTASFIFNVPLADVDIEDLRLEIED